MKINPGGKLDMGDIVGRDPLVAFIRERMLTQSLVLVAERRMGKTHVLHKLAAKPLAGWLLLQRDVEGLRSATEFVQYILADLYPHLSKAKQFRDWVNAMVSDAGGAQLGPIKLPNFPPQHWKKILQDAATHIQSAKEIGYVAFLWDELPWMLQNIAKTNPQEATELLDALRALRQQHDKLRMVFTGSIGLHHIVRQLKAQGYNNAPTNDMASVEVPPLTLDDARDLAASLLGAIGLAEADRALPLQIAQAVDCIPYYIHHVLSDLSKHQNPSASANWSQIQKIVDAAIKSPHDPWNLKHYEDRARDYYGTQRDACLDLLDAVAGGHEGVELQTAINGARASHPEVAQNDWLELVRLLQRDYYLVRNEQTGVLTFKFGVVRRWWQWQRNITVSAGAAS